MVSPARQFNAMADDERVLDVVRELVAEIGHESAVRSASPASHLERDLGLGSLERVELLLRLEKAFGTRLDENTHKIIEHGQRIRAILKQPEFEPASVPEQIVILVALTGGLLDNVPIDKVRDAEQALRKAAADIPAEVRQRFSSNDPLSDEDRKAILQIAGKAIAPFQPKPDPESNKKP